MINSNQTNVEQDMLTIAPNHPQTYSGANEIGILATSIRYGLFSRSNGSGTFYTTSGHLNSNTWYKYYLKVVGTSVTGKIYDVNGNVLHSATQTLSSAQSYKKWNIIVGGESQTVQWKNLKIKPL